MYFAFPIDRANALVEEGGPYVNPNPSLNPNPNPAGGRGREGGWWRKWVLVVFFFFLVHEGCSDPSGQHGRQ